jgi:hypothetical protein
MAALDVSRHTRSRVARSRIATARRVARPAARKRDQRTSARSRAHSRSACSRSVLAIFVLAIRAGRRVRCFASVAPAGDGKRACPGLADRPRRVQAAATSSEAGPAPSSVSSPDRFFTHLCCKDTEALHQGAARRADRLGDQRPSDDTESRCPTRRCRVYRILLAQARQRVTRRLRCLRRRRLGGRSLRRRRLGYRRLGRRRHVRRRLHHRR